MVQKQYRDELLFFNVFLTSFIFIDFFLYFLSINIVFNVYNEHMLNIVSFVIETSFQHINIYIQ